MVFGMLSRSHESACNETARSSYSTGFMHGMLPDHPYVAHAKNLAFALTLLAFADHLIIKPWVAKKVAAKDLGTTRWFFIHSLANAFVCLSGLKSMKAVALDPLRAFDGAAFSEDETGFFGAISVWPLTIINAVHIYHMIGGFSLTPADYFHHGLFIPTIALPGQVYRWGPLSNFQAFFISGLPGGIDYLLLGLQKVGMLNHMTEKRVNANLNTVRGLRPLLEARCESLAISSLSVLAHRRTPPIRHLSPPTQLLTLSLPCRPIDVAAANSGSVPRAS
jgi:hypothetical protein